jgi:polyisoprenoid-binding protein YceI
MQKFVILVFSLCLLLAGCEDPAANKPKAVLSESNSNSSSNLRSPEPDQLSAFQTRGTGLQISPENSRVEFTGSKVTGKHEGGFKLFKGLIDLVNEKIEDSRVAVEIDMTSVFTDTDALTKHLQTGDFFEVASFPKSSFVSTRIDPDEAGGAGRYLVTGDLVLRGVRKAVTFPALISVSPEQVTVNSEFAINRKDFGIVYAGKADDLIRDDVLIKLDLKAPRSK